MNPRPPGYEPDELPDCSTPRYPSKAIRSDGKNNYSTFRRACQPVRRKFPDKLQRARPPARTVRAAPVVPPPTSQSRGTAPAERRKSPRPQNRPDKKSASRSFPRPRPHHKVAAPRPPSAEKARARKTVQTKNQHRGRSPGSAHITKSRHPRSPSAERPTKPSRCKTGIQSPRPPLCTQKARPPCGSRASFAGNQALILRMAVAVTCVGAALVPASALS